MTSYPPPPDDSAEQPPPYPATSPYPESSAGMPVYPQGAGSGSVTPPVEQPPSIARAVLLMRVGAGLSLLSTIVGLLTLDSLKDNIRQSLQDSNNFTQSNLDTAYNVAIGFVIGVGIIGIVLWLWMAQTNGNGRKWARIVATVLGALSIIGFLTAIAQNQETALGLVLSAVTAVLAIVILVLLWRGESTAYYNAKSRPQLS